MSGRCEAGQSSLLISEMRAGVCVKLLRGGERGLLGFISCGYCQKSRGVLAR